MGQLAGLGADPCRARYEALAGLLGQVRVEVDRRPRHPPRAASQQVVRAHPIDPACPPTLYPLSGDLVAPVADDVGGADRFRRSRVLCRRGLPRLRIRLVLAVMLVRVHRPAPHRGASSRPRCPGHRTPRPLLGVGWLPSGRRWTGARRPPARSACLTTPSSAAPPPAPDDRTPRKRLVAFRPTTFRAG